MRLSTVLLISLVLAACGSSPSDEDKAAYVEALKATGGKEANYVWAPDELHINVGESVCQQYDENGVSGAFDNLVASRNQPHQQDEAKYYYAVMVASSEWLCPKHKGSVPEWNPTPN